MKVDIQRHIDAELEDQKMFNSPTHGRLTFKEVIFRIGAFMHHSPDASYEVVLGTDSQHYNGYVDFVSAIIVHRFGGGGIYFWQRERINKKFVLRDRMYHEAVMSMDLARVFMDQFQMEGIIKFDLEIHIDVGNNGKTKDLINEVVGMVRSSGFTVKTKPEAYGAANIADRYT